MAVDTARTLVTTYLGHDAAARILRGEIDGGQAKTVHKVPRFPAGEEQPQLPRFRALQVHRPVPADLHRERDVAGVDPVGLDRHGADRRLHVPGVNADHQQARRGQAVAQPGRQRPRLDADPFEGQAGRAQECGDGLRFARGLAFAHDPAVVVDDADRRLFHRDVKADIVLHGCPPQAADARLGRISDPVQASLEGSRLPVTPLRTRSPITPSLLDISMTYNNTSSDGFV